MLSQFFLSWTPQPRLKISRIFLFQENYYGNSAQSDNLLLLFGDDNKKEKGNNDQHAEDVEGCHKISDIHKNYFLAKTKLISQQTAEEINPKENTFQLTEPLTAGSINTEAKNTCAISRKISDSDSGLSNLFTSRINFVSNSNTTRNKKTVNDIFPLLHSKIIWYNSRIRKQFSKLNGKTKT